MRSVRLSAATAVALLSLAFVGPGASRGQEASGGVSVAPMMVLMDTRGRPGSFEVINFGDQAETFRLEPLYAYIDEEGVQRFEAAAEQPGSALSFLRFAPRQFEIQPGSTRTVRLSARPPPDLAPGEYRLHLRVTNIGPTPSRPVTSAERTVGFNLRIQVAQAVRVLVRHGVGPGSAHVQGLRSEQTQDGRQLRFDLVNDGGGGSVLGRYVAVAVTGNGSERLLREADVTLYPDTRVRPVRLDVPANELALASSVCVRFRLRGGDGEQQSQCVPVEAGDGALGTGDASGDRTEPR